MAVGRLKRKPGASSKLDITCEGAVHALFWLIAFGHFSDAQATRRTNILILPLACAQTS
jgi:hypothetical protein